jgi:O-antigen/teichoic acid export membrane protein
VSGFEAAFSCENDPLRTRRSALTYASGLLFTAVTTLTALGSTPYLVAWLTPDRYGAYRMINGWYGYLNLLDFGLGAALSPLLARALGQQDAKALRGTLGAGIRAYLCVTLLAIGVGLALTPFIVWQVPAPPPPAALVALAAPAALVAPGGLAVLAAPAVLAALAAAQRSVWVGDLWIGWVACLLSFLPLALAPLRTLAEANQRGYWVNVLLTVQCLLITALSLVFAYRGWGITGQALAFSLGIMTFLGMLAWEALRRNPGLLRAAFATKGDPEIWRAIRGLSFPSLLLALGGRIGLLSDEIVAGGVLGIGKVPSLSLTVRLANLAQAQLQAVGNASWAGLVELYVQGDHTTFRRRLLELTKMVAVLGLAVLGPVAAYNHAFFNLWMGPKLVAFGGNQVTVIVAVNAFLLSLLSLWGWCFTGLGRARMLVAPSMLATVVNLTASILFTHWLGLVGPVLGTLVATVAVNLWWYPFLLRTEFGISVRALLWTVAWPLAWGLPYAAGLWWLAHSHRVWGWFGLAAETGSAALGFLILGSLVILSPAERALWHQRLAGLFPFLYRPRSAAKLPADAEQSDGPMV